MTGKVKSKGSKIRITIIFDPQIYGFPAYECENLWLGRYFVLGFTAPFVRIRHGLPCFILCVNFPRCKRVRYRPLLMAYCLASLPLSVDQRYENTYEKLNFPYRCFNNSEADKSYCHTARDHQLNENVRVR